MNELLLEVAAKQKELSEGMKNVGTPQVEEEEEDSDSEEEEEEEEEGFSHRQPQAAPAFVGPNVSLSNGSGSMFNSNIGNIANTIVSNVGNNNSRNYYG